MFFIVSILSCNGVIAQDLYRIVLKEYMEYCNPVLEKSLNDMSSSLEGQTKNILTDFGDSQVSALAARYREEDLLDVFIDSMFVPAFQHYVSYEDIQNQIGNHKAFIQNLILVF